MKVLLVDDSQAMRVIQMKILEQLGDVEFTQAADGVEAMAVLAGSPGAFDLIVIDWNMPNMNGITLVHKIRETDKKTPLVMAATEADKERVLEAIRAGVNNYIVKPFTPALLLEKVQATLGRAKAAA